MNSSLSVWISLRADLHGTIFVAYDNDLRQAHDMIYDCCVRQQKCRSILKHVLKRCDNRKSCYRPVASLSHATRIVPCKSALIQDRLDCQLIRADLHNTILSHATSSRQAYDMTYDCRSVLKHVLKCYDIFSAVHNNSKSCRGPVISRQSRTV